MEQLLIQANDIREFWQLGKNIPDERVSPHILRAQQSDLKPFLGEELYYDFINNLTDQKYQDLLKGKEYINGNGNTVFFSGVKPMLAAYAYARIKKNADDFLTRAGNKYKETTESSIPPHIRNINKAREAESDAIRLQQEVFDFLVFFGETYPLWSMDRGTNKTGFRISKISRFKGY